MGTIQLALVVTLLTIACPHTQLNTNMPSARDFLNLTTTLRFVAPAYNKKQWQQIDSELKETLSPLHFGLANNVINPQDAGMQFSETLYDFFGSKPEFIVENGEKEAYRKNQPNAIQEAKKLKNDLRKKIQKKDATKEDRKMFGQSVRYHNYVLKEQKLRDKDNARKNQEKMYHDNFWEFSRKLSRGELNKPAQKPTFDKSAADEYYPRMYSTAPHFDLNTLNWFPYLHVPPSPVNFNLSPVKPKDIKNILSHKKSTSAPGPDGLTYGILRHLPSTHHFLSTLYSKLILDSPSPPELWQASNVSLIYKRNETSNPKNFRMIALTSVIGKIYHQIVSDRILDFMIGNGYINAAVQKAFIKNINGTVEHNQLLQEVISNARKNKKTVHVTFFDLKDAFGSISHKLIDTVLERYHIPENIKMYVNSLYSNINGSVVGPGWRSDRFKFNRGVFQGDPLSPTIFICVFNPLLEYLLSEQKHGYFIDKDTPIVSTPFADDFNVITTNSRTHQRILTKVEQFAKSMNLILEPTKCKSLSICAGYSKTIKFKLSDQIIESIYDNPEKFLGAQITFSGKQSDIFTYIFDGIKATLDNIDASLIRDEYKVKVYSQYFIPAVRFKLTVHDITNTNLNKLDALSDKYVKKWLNMPPSGTLAIIHTAEGLSIKSLSHLYKETHAISHASSRLKADRQVNVALDSRIDRERQWSRKGSITVFSEDHFQNSISDIPGEPDQSNINIVKSHVKKSISQEIQDMWYNHIKGLTVQGRFLDLLHLEGTHLTWRSIMYNLPRGVLQFAVNASIDTLATNANLKRWGKRNSAKCDLCGQRETLHHTLNHCPTMLERYGWRHDSILNHLTSLFKTNMPEDTTLHLYADLDSEYQGISTVPIDVAITPLRPDIVLVDRSTKNVILFELSVPFECNVYETHQRKVERYRKLISDIEENGYAVAYYPVEIGSRGHITKVNLNRLKSFIRKVCKDVKFTPVKNDLCKIVLVASFVVYHSKYDKDWSTPSYVTL